MTVHGNVGEGWGDMAKCDMTDGSGVRQGTGRETGGGVCQEWGLWVVPPGRAWPPIPLPPISFPPQPWAHSQGWLEWVKGSGIDLGNNR